MWLGFGTLDPISGIFCHVPHSVHRITHKFLLMTSCKNDIKEKLTNNKLSANKNNVKKHCSENLNFFHKIYRKINLM